ncbi:uncharacterized protein LOC141909227 [Tubulanus polymorphus]|uniref:uncharacterized protein LOC141909227 n=1 Tax=Tubulanus polymorphus TaxID=672921 RepID=UPI003DA49A05
MGLIKEENLTCDIPGPVSGANIFGSSSRFVSVMASSRILVALVVILVLTSANCAPTRISRPMSDLLQMMFLRHATRLGGDSEGSNPFCSKPNFVNGHNRTCCVLHDTCRENIRKLDVCSNHKVGKYYNIDEIGVETNCNDNLSHCDERFCKCDWQFAHCFIGDGENQENLMSLVDEEASSSIFGEANIDKLKAIMINQLSSDGDNS